MNEHQSTNDFLLRINPNSLLSALTDGSVLQTLLVALLGAVLIAEVWVGNLTVIVVTIATVPEMVWRRSSCCTVASLTFFTPLTRLSSALTAARSRYRSTSRAEAVAAARAGILCLGLQRPGSAAAFDVCGVQRHQVTQAADGASTRGARRDSGATAGRGGLAVGCRQNRPKVAFEHAARPREPSVNADCRVRSTSRRWIARTASPTMRAASYRVGLMLVMEAR